MIDPGQFFVVAHGRRYVSAVFDDTDQPTFCSCLVTQRVDCAEQFESQEEAVRVRDRLRKMNEEHGSAQDRKKPVEVFKISVEQIP